MKNKEVVSRIKNQLNLLTKDQQVNDRFILFTAQNIATTFISQKLKEMSLFREFNLYKEVPCIDMEKVDTKLCGIFEFSNCSTLIKSKKKIPNLIYSRLGSSIKEVTSIDSDFKFYPSTISDYRNNSKRKGFKKGNHFYIKDDYLYIPDVSLKKINILILSLDHYELDQVSECCDNCQSAWDYDFITPSKLLEPIIESTVNQLIITKQIPKDENPNLSSTS